METPEWGIEPEISLPDYIDLVRDTLKYWLDVHTNPVAWACSWCSDDNWQDMYESHPIMGNAFFTFDIKEHLSKYAARRQRKDFAICPRCGILCDSWFERCDECNRKLRQATIAEITEWFDEFGFDASDEDIKETLIKDGFKVYYEEIKDIIAQPVKDVREALRMFRTSDPAKLLLAAAWANHVQHVFGNVLEDYSCEVELDYDLVCRVSEEGFAGVFGQKQVDDFLAA